LPFRPGERLGVAVFRIETLCSGEPGKELGRRKNGAVYVGAEFEQVMVAGDDGIGVEGAMQARGVEAGCLNREPGVFAAFCMSCGRL
jgi:hypothetical protein